MQQLEFKLPADFHHWSTEQQAIWLWTQLAPIEQVRAQFWGLAPEQCRNADP